MRSFEDIHAIAAARHGGAEAVEAMLTRPEPPEVLAALPEDRWLSMFSRMVFCAGFNWKVIEAKWPGFEDAFDGFDPDRCGMMDDDRFDALLTDTRIVRYAAKIAAVRDNAVFLRELRSDGGAGVVIGGWPSEDYMGLLQMLKTRGNRLGGTTGQYALRMLGRDSVIFSRDVVARLVAEGIVDKAPTSKKAMAAVQDALNRWRADSGRSLNEISRVLALSI